MKKTKIDWCDCTINPVVGCPRGCEYCYACKMNKRFKWIADWTKPQFFPERLNQLYSKKSKSIFMDSMSDFHYWENDWVFKTRMAIRDNPQHNYIFLTKTFTDTIIGDKNTFNGVSITTQRQNDLAAMNMEFDFYSIEPILEPIKLVVFKENIKLKQVIIGAETGNRKNKVIPKKEWIDNIVKQCNKHNIRIFMKSSLKKLMGVDLRQDKLIWAVTENE